jgi:hypothetical protein
MKDRIRTLALLVSAALLATGGLIRAEQPLLLDAPAAPDKPLMAGLTAAGAGDFLKKNNIAVYGFVEGSYTWNEDSPHSNTNFGRVFDFEHDELNMNQLDLTIERTVDPSQKKWDVGGRVEWIYGTDAGFIHSNGLFDWYDNARDPQNQYDLNQAYVDVAAPLGNGVLVRAGKFNTLLGYEVVNPTGNPLFSHGYLFNFALPFTHTGVLASYTFNDQWSATAGIVRGWDQALEDNNGSVSLTGQVKWTPNKVYSVLVNFITGPERTNNSGDYRSVMDVVATYNPNDKWSFVVNADFGWESSASANGDTAYWYGIAGYAGYKINDYFTVNGRLEWFRDEEGTRTGVTTNYYEATLGVNIHPLPTDRWGQYLQIRPEVRGDYAGKSVYNDLNDNSMFTFALDAIYSF